jgi:formylglycine-generating enzyme required for sulfatase activity/tRNA A-37 threonylcarbamoyl transferase component Bud32
MARADADRNLLFGVLALQMDFISREALIAAVSAWALDKGRPLDQILVEQGALAVAHRDLLAPLVRAHLEHHGDDPARSLAAVESASSVREALRQVADADVLATLADAAARADGGHPEASATAADGVEVWNPRFRILRPHAKGGLGEVFVARDVELNRQVALKEIQVRHADHPTSRARFLLEAEITGALEHPGIVPVYGLGHYPDGRPFYAMRFVKGDNLADAIKRFHAAEPAGRDPGARALEFRTLLGRFVDVCNAIAYAHSKGVLHRDLKPENIMLGKYGETLVVDWGLAKPIGKADPSLHPDEEPVAPSSGGSGLETLPGKALGTPQFMSPEQAAGELDRLGPQSDVYSLGATLYMVLTGRPAFEDRDVGVVIQKVLRGEFPPPRQVDRKVPGALEAICLKAMAPESGGRYASPRALAEDVERWLADEPVAAWREPWATRARRWVGRHRTSVTAAAAAAVVALAAGGYFLYEARLRAAQRLTAARGRVYALASAEIRAMPLIIEQLGADRRLVRDRLERMARGDGPGSNGRRKLAAALALLPEDPAQADFLAGRLLSRDSTPEEVLVIRDALIAQRLAYRVAPRFRRALPTKPPAALEAAPLRAAGALARIAPDDPALAALAGPIARSLMRENQLRIGSWREVFEPIESPLGGPLRAIYSDRGEHDLPRSLAFTLLSEFASRPDNRSQAEDLAALVGDADPDQFGQLLGRLGAEANRGRAIAYLAPKVEEPARYDDDLARRQGRWALALLRLGRPEAAWRLFRQGDDPSVRTELIHELPRFGFDPALVVERLRVESSTPGRRALLLCLAEFPPRRLSESDRRQLADRFKAWYASDPDPGVHGGLRWLLQRWGQAEEMGRVDKELARRARPKGRDWYVGGQIPFRDAGVGGPPDARGWYVNAQGQTFAIIRGPVVYPMGSTEQGDPDRDPDELRHPRRIGRSFAIATREVTVAEYTRFLESHPAGVSDFRAHPQFKQDITGPDCAIGGVTWYEAARYCNWLSAEEGIPEEQWCYGGKIGPGMEVPADFLDRTGYRLPTEAEWEYACRAGTASSRPYGRSEEWLPEYGWYLANSGRTMHPAGRKKPNDLGLFDMLGNAYEWCSDPHVPYRPGKDGQPADDTLLDPDFSDDVVRVLRGGSFGNSAPLLRSADRYWFRPTSRFTFIGFRPARTYP